MNMNNIIESPTRENLQINYADPAGVGNIVIGTGQGTGIALFNFTKPNILVDARATTAPAGADDHRLSIRRPNGNVVMIANWTDILPANTRTVKGVMPKGVNSGTFQWIAEEIVVAAAGVNVVWTFGAPIAF